MARNSLAAHSPWRQLLIISLALPLVIMLAALAFWWPAARLAPRGLPVGIVITGPARQQAVEALTQAEPGSFDLRLYSDEASARTAIEHRDVYGAFVITTSHITVLEASAASPAVAQLLTNVGLQLARHGTETAAGSASSLQRPTVTSVDVAAPRRLPVGIVGTGLARQRAVEALTQAELGVFDLRLYDDEASARTAIEHRDVYGAFLITTSHITALEASTASPAVARLLTNVGQQMATFQPSPTVTSVDIIAPHGLPVGIVGAGPARQQAVEALTQAVPGVFDLRLYDDEASARTAIEHRDVYGAFLITTSHITALEASTASPTVARLLTNVGQQLAHRGSRTAAGGASPQPPSTVTAIDVVATSSSDPRGLVLNSIQLPLLICGVIIAGAIALLLRFRPAWRQLLALLVVSATAGLGAYLIGQGFLGALPHEHAATWAALALTLLAVSTTTAGLIALIGAPGLGLGAALMVLAGNAFSAGTSAPQLVPAAIGHIGQWLPAGAGNNLIRSTAYFNGHGAAGHLSVLVTWSVLGLAAIVVGHHPVRLAASRPHHSASRPHHSASRPHHSEGPYHGLHATTDEATNTNIRF